MAYTDLQLLRKTIADPFRNGFDEIVADGDAQDFQLSHHPVKDSSLTVYKNDVVVNSADYDVDLEQGLVTFDTLPSAEDKIEAKYQYSVFSDEELTNFLALDGTVNKAAIRCFEILLTDAARRFDYTAGLTDVKASQIFDHLKGLLDYYKGKVSSSDAPVRIYRRVHGAYGFNQSNQEGFIGQESTVTPGDLSKDDL